MPIWYQDGLTNQWKSKKLFLQGKGYTSNSPDGSNKFIWLPLQKIQPKGDPNIQTRDETAKTPGRRNSITSHDSLKICMAKAIQYCKVKKKIIIIKIKGKKSSKKYHAWRQRPYDLPSWGQIKTLTNQAENLISQQEMPQNPENIFLCYACFASFASPTRVDLIDHT